MHWRVLPVITIIVNSMALLLLVVSFGTEHWVEYEVDRATLQKIAASDSDLQTNLNNMTYYEDRHKGLFRTCHTDTMDKCIKRTGYELGSMSSDTPSDEWSDLYTTRVHMMRTHLFSLALAIPCLAVALVVVILGTMKEKAIMFRIACGTSTIACFMVALGMAVFHGIEYLEKKKITEIGEFPAAWETQPEHYELSNNVEINFGFSMYLGWVSLVLTIFVSIMTMWTGVNSMIDPSSEKNQLTYAPTSALSGVSALSANSERESYYSSSLARNRAYDIVEGKDTGEEDVGFDNSLFSKDSKDIFIGTDMGKDKY